MAKEKQATLHTWLHFCPKCERSFWTEGEGPKFAIPPIFCPWCGGQNLEAYEDEPGEEE